MSEVVKKSFCFFCLADCGINLTLENNKIKKITSNFDDPVSQGYICHKAQKLIDHQYTSDRITSPLKKINDTFVPISWDQAFEEITDKLSTIIKNDRAERIFFMSQNIVTFQSNNLYFKELAHAMGIRYCSDIYSIERIYKKFVHGQFFNNPITTDLDNCETVLLVGINPYVSNHFPQIVKKLNKIKNDPTRNIIVIDPRDSETAVNKNVTHVKLNNGTDAWFFSMLIKALIENDWVDNSFIDSKLENYQSIKDHFTKIDTDEYSKICGIGYDRATQIAKIIGSSQSLSIETGNGLCHSVYPMNVSYFLMLITLITNHYQKTGSMSHYPTFPVQNYFDKSTTPLTNQRQLFGTTSYSLISENLISNDDQFDAVIITGCNPAKQGPNTELFKQTLAKLNLVVVIDSFMTETAKLGDYVLPTPTFFERYEILNLHNDKHGFLQLSRPVLDYQSYTKTTAEILEEFLDRLEIHSDNYDLQEYEKNPTDFLMSIWSKFTDKEIKYPLRILRQAFKLKFEDPYIANIWWHLMSFNFKYRKNLNLEECVNLTNKQIEELVDTGVIRFNSDINTNELRPTNKINLTPGIFKSLLKLNKVRLFNSNFEFILVTGNKKKTSVNSLLLDDEESYVEIHSEDALKQNISNGDLVKITTEAGEICIKSLISDRVNKGTLCIQNTHNELTHSMNIDYLNPQYKYIFANIRKI